MLRRPRGEWLLATLLGAGGCSGLPDIRFVEPVEGGGDASSTPDGPGPADARDDVAPLPDAGGDTCAKAFADDVCCGALVCRGECTPDRCAGCLSSCAPPAFCCARPTTTQCKTGGACN